MPISELRKVEFEDVMNYYIGQHGCQSESDQRALARLVKADCQLGEWFQTEITVDRLLDVMLPHHNHHAKMELVPPQGLPVSKAHEKLRQIEREYGIANPQCLEDIRHFNGRPIGRLILSEKPVFGDVNYAHMSDWEGHFISIDGLHRLLRLAYNNAPRTEFIGCYIAAKN